MDDWEVDGKTTALQSTPRQVAAAISSLSKWSRYSLTEKRNWWPDVGFVAWVALMAAANR